MTGARACLLAVALLLGGASPALAHKLKVFAAAEGDRVSGYAYFGGGVRAVGARVTVEAEGARVLDATTDGSGGFAFRAARRADHLIVVDGGDGHVAQFTLAAADLPEAEAADAPADLQAAVERAVARQIRPLREQLDAYEDKIRWHDALGGVGYIVGLAGLAYGLAARRRAD